MRPDLILQTSKISIYQQQLGPWDNLNHLVVCNQTQQACIVDPFDGEFWHDFCRLIGVKITEIWLTHSHWDHIKGVEELLQIADNEIMVRCHILEQERGFTLPDVYWWEHAECTNISQNFGALNFAIHCTPGHSPGHVVFIVDGAVISGDCLFLGSCGRTDLYGGSKFKQRISLLYLRDILRNLPQDNLVLPGHQYPLADGSNPHYLKLSVVLSDNLALKAVDDDKKWDRLPFLSFDDELAEKARRQKTLDS